MKNYPVHLVGTIYWLPPHKQGRVKFPPGHKFIAIARFTSDLSGSTLEAVVSYSPFQEDDIECYQVRLSYRMLGEHKEELERLAKNTEILIMDAYRVIAVCRDIAIPQSGLMIDDEWTDSTDAK
jgi:hypothetical protein